MISLLKADVYRIVREKMFYLAFATLLVFWYVMVLSLNVNNMGWIELTRIYANMSYLVFFVLFLNILVSGSMFSCGTIKNELSAGMSRITLYFSKLLLSSFFSLIVFLIYVILSDLFIIIQYGSDKNLPFAFWMNSYLISTAQLSLLLALNCVCTFMLFVTRRTAITMGVFLAFCLIPYVLIEALQKDNPIMHNLFLISKMYTLTSVKPPHWSYRDLTQANAFSSWEVTQAFVLSAFYITVSTIAGIVLFKKAEIK